MDDEQVRALYREPPEGFIAARDALVKELKDAGQAEDAAQAKALRKPTVSAWAVDQLADLEPDSITELLDAGTEVRASQQAALSSGANADRLREATAARRQIVSRLARAASDILREAGRSPDQHIDDIRTTLEAASVDEEAGARLRAGTLDRAIHEAGGFGDGFGLQLVPDLGERPSQKRGRERNGTHPSELDIARLRRDAASAARKARQSRETADQLAGQLDSMNARLTDLMGKHAEAESAALQAELESTRAAEALRSAGG
jgi:hypothetical protein